MKKKKIISVICPVYNESKYFASFIKSILAQDYSKENMEVLLIDGMSTDNTREIMDDFAKRYSFIKLLDNPYQNVSQALNIGIKASIGEIIIRLDIHCLYPFDYFSTLVEKLIELNADNVGGVIYTRPENSTSIAKVISIAISHPFGVGNSLFRIGCKRTKEVDTVPFGCFRKTLFDRIGYFDTDFKRNQDDEFNARIKKNGGKIYLIPEVIITYFSRDTIFKVSKMFFQYGLYKPLVLKKIGSPATVRQFFPMLFILASIIGLSISLFNKEILWITAETFMLYFIISIYFSIKQAFKNKKLFFLILLPYTFFIIHISYGWGYIIGIIKFIILRKKSYEVDISR